MKSENSQENPVIKHQSPRESLRRKIREGPRKKQNKPFVRNARLYQAHYKAKRKPGKSRLFFLGFLLAAAVISAAAAEEKQQNDPAAVISAESTATAAAVTIAVTAESDQNQDPDQAAASTVAVEKAETVTAVTSTSAFTFASAVCCCDITHCQILQNYFDYTSSYGRDKECVTKLK